MSTFHDPRNIVHGFEIPSEGYCDQPYVVKTEDGAWLCVLTTGKGNEGDRGQHVVSARSMDHGRTWSELVAVESSDGPEASYAVLLKVPGGRIYCFYNHNSDNMRHVIADDPPFENGKCQRVDSLGYFVFVTSDDHGHTWSEKRYTIPVREMAIDRENAYGGKVRFFWNVGKPFIHDGAAYVSLHKVGGFGEGFFTRSEGVLLKSENILTEKDPEKITWETLPDGDAGLRTPPGGGPIAEEHSYSVLSDGSFYCVYRTIDGHPAFSYSRDAGRTWTVPRYKSFADGRLMKHPRAANFAWKCSNGKVLYWFHNHGGRFVREDAGIAYKDRNPVWLCGGVEADTPEGKMIRWSQPEIVLYDDDPETRISYPDFIEEEGHYFITETQKTIARVHEVDAGLLEGLWNQSELSTVAEKGLVLSLNAEEGKSLGSVVDMPRLPDLSQGGGFAVDFWIQFDHLDADQIVLDSRGEDGKGIALKTTDRGTIQISLNDGRTACAWDCDQRILKMNVWHHVAVIVDGSPKIITFIVDGVLCDGGEIRQFGWGRFNKDLGDINGAERVKVALALNGRLKVLRIYDRYLRTSEAIGNFQAG